MSQALYRKWRPVRFEEVIGQDHITQTLQNSVAAERVGHAYLFCGPRGTGKTTTARLLAKAVNCLDEDPAKRPCNQCATCQSINNGRFLDLIEIDAASNTGVDDIRDLRDKINFAPNLGRFKVYIIDEVHMLSTAAFNALLKTLEEPPAHAMFILATTEEHKVPATIKSRCQQFNFRLLSTAEISSRLAWLGEQESLTIEPGALELIARQGAGSLRDAESLLDQLIVAPGDTITLQRAQMVLGTAANASVVALTDAWLNATAAEGLGVIHEALASGADPRQFCRQMVDHLRTILILQASGPQLTLEIPDDYKEAILTQAQRAPRQDLIQAVKRFQEAALKPISGWQPQLPLELAFMDLLPDAPAPIIKVSTLKERSAAQQVAAKPVIYQEQEDVETVQLSAPNNATTGEDIEETTTESVQPAIQKVSTAAPVAEGDKLSLPAVKANWRAMVAAAAQKDKNLPALLAMSKPLAVEGDIIVLGFDFPIFKEKFDKTDHGTAIIGDIFSDLTGLTCGIRCVVTSEYIVPISREEMEALAEELGGVVHEDS
ncbi:MAG: DNA polymerase III subunit gamma/tau [Candidatus Promineifilaceae bacterium]|nr:DNA polymerase III subunit gamma/tau [Candidatus Promineifilaceae bacterium]